MAGIQPKPTELGFRRWSPGVTAELIDAWASLYNRRRGGQCDAWVPLHQRSRALTGRDLVPEDWRAVATAVNCYLGDASLNRTPEECERRVNLLRARYGDELTKPSWVRFLPTIDDGAEDVAAPAAAHGVRPGPDGYGRGTTAADEGVAAANPKRPRNPSGKSAWQANAKGAAAAAGGRTAATRKMRGHAAGVVPAQGGPVTARDLFGGVIPPKRRRTGLSTSTTAAARAPIFNEELVRPVSISAAAAHGGPATTTAARELFGGPIPKRSRTGCYTSAGAPSRVKQELVRQARDARLGAEGAVGGVGVAVDAPSDASLAAWAEGRSDNAALMAALGSHTASLGRMYVQLERERIDLERKRIDLEKKKLEFAAEPARGGAAAGGLP